MIVKEHQIEKIVRDNKKFLNILIYGPNEGLVREQIEKLANDYLSKAGYSLNKKQLFRIFHVISSLFTIVIPIIYLARFAVTENGFLFSLWVFFWVALISYPTVFLITFLLFFIATT